MVPVAFRSFWIELPLPWGSYPFVALMDRSQSVMESQQPECECATWSLFCHMKLIMGNFGGTTKEAISQVVTSPNSEDQGTHNRWS